MDCYGIASLFYIWVMFIPRKKHTYGPTQPVTEITLLSLYYEYLPWVCYFESVALQCVLALMHITFRGILKPWKAFNVRRQLIWHGKVVILFRGDASCDMEMRRKCCSCFGKFRGGCPNRRVENRHTFCWLRTARDGTFQHSTECSGMLAVNFPRVIYGWKSRCTRSYNNSLPSVPDVFLLVQVPPMLPYAVPCNNSSCIPTPSCLNSTGYSCSGFCKSQPEDVHRKCLVRGRMSFTWTGVSNIHNQHVWSYEKSSLDSIIPSETTVFHQPVGWNLRWLPRRSSHVTVTS
jgi:hypothetical protein